MAYRTLGNEKELLGRLSLIETTIKLLKVERNIVIGMQVNLA